MVVDAFAAIGLAGNVVAFVDFGAKLFSEAREIYRCGGCADKHTEVDCLTRDLDDVHDKLQKEQRHSQSTGLDLNLIELADRSVSLSSELRNILASLQTTSPSKAQSIRLAFRAHRRKDKMDDIQTRLSEIRQQITLHLQTSSR